jgi:hypothetical protein
VSNSGYGLIRHFQEVKKLQCWGLHPYAGEIRHVLKRKTLRFLADILFYACVLTQYWAGLYPEDTQKMIAAGVELMMKTALHLLGKKGRPRSVLMLKDVSEDKEDDAVGRADMQNDRTQACSDAASGVVGWSTSFLLTCKAERYL